MHEFKALLTREVESLFTREFKSLLKREVESLYARV